MEIKRQFIIRGGELAQEKQEEIVRDIVEGLIADNSSEVRELLLEMSADPFDMGRIEPEGAIEYLNRTVREELERTACSWEVKITL